MNLTHVGGGLEDRQLPGRRTELKEQLIQSSSLVVSAIIARLEEDELTLIEGQ